MVMIKFKSIARTPIVSKPVVAAPEVTRESTTENHGSVTVVGAVPPTAKNDYVLLFNDSDRGYGYKVWSVWREGRELVTEWGPEYGTKVSKRKLFTSAVRATSEIANLVETKRKKGYRVNK